VRQSCSRRQLLVCNAARNCMLALMTDGSLACADLLFINNVQCCGQGELLKVDLSVSDYTAPNMVA